MKSSYKNISLIVLAVSMTACASMAVNQNKVQLLESDSTLINGCQKLGPINIDTQAIDFNQVAIGEFKRVAFEKYNADSAVITHRENKALGHVVIQGTALKCYS